MANGFDDVLNIIERVRGSATLNQLTLETVSTLKAERIGSSVDLIVNKATEVAKISDAELKKIAQDLLKELK